MFTATMKEPRSFVSSPLGRQEEGKSADVSKLVRYERAPNTPLTEAQKAELEALAKIPDSEIDYSDIPPLSDEFFERAIRNRHLHGRRKPAKKAG
jgi:hypothetical protein